MGESMPDQTAGTGLGHREREMVSGQMTSDHLLHRVLPFGIDRLAQTHAHKFTGRKANGPGCQRHAE